MNVTSTFINNCWKLVGHDATDPAGLTELFATFEQEREQLAKVQERLRVALDETSDVYNKLNTARTELKRYEERESTHLQPLFTALVAHLLFPLAPEAESIKSLLRRVERARAFNAKWGASSEPTLDAATERRAEEAERAMKASRAGQADVERVREANAQLAHSKEAQLKLSKELDAANAEVARLEGLITAQTERIQKADRLNERSSRLVVANYDLSLAIDEWRRVTGTQSE